MIIIIMVFCKIWVLSLVTDSKLSRNISTADVFTTNPLQIHLYCRVGKIPPSRLHPVQVVALAILGYCISFFLASFFMQNFPGIVMRMRHMREQRICGTYMREYAPCAPTCTYMKIWPLAIPSSF